MDRAALSRRCRSVNPRRAEKVHFFPEQMGIWDDFLFTRSEELLTSPPF